MECSDIRNFADDATLHNRSTDINEAIFGIKHDCLLLIKWFRNNFMTLNASKCPLYVFCHKD